MTKPLDYYAGYPNGNPLLEEIQQKYGSSVEGCNLREKLFLLQFIATDFACQANGQTMRPEIAELAARIVTELELRDKRGLLEALADQINSNQIKFED